MSLSNLTQLAGGSLPAYTRYSPSPTGVYTGPSETELQISILGSLNSDTNVMVFSVNDSIDTSSSLGINTSASTDTINVTDGGPTTPGATYYYAVNFGTDTSRNEWSLNFNITLKDGSTASWIFTKGKSEEDLPK